MDTPRRPVARVLERGGGAPRVSKVDTPRRLVARARGAGVGPRASNVRDASFRRAS